MYFKLNLMLSRHTPYSVPTLLFLCFENTAATDLDTLKSMFTVKDNTKEYTPTCLDNLPYVNVEQDTGGLLDVTPTDTHINVLLETNVAETESTIDQWVDVLRFLMPFAVDGLLEVTVGDTVLTANPYGDVIATTGESVLTFTPDENDDYTRVLLKGLHEYGQQLDAQLALGKELVSESKNKYERMRRVLMASNKLLLSLNEPLNIPLVFAQQAVLLSIAKLTDSGRLYTTFTLNLQKGLMKNVFYSRTKMAKVIDDLTTIPGEFLVDSVRETLDAIWEFY